MVFFLFFWGVLVYTSGVIAMVACFAAWIRTRQSAFLTYALFVATTSVSLFLPNWGAAWGSVLSRTQPWTELASLGSYSAYFSIVIGLMVAFGQAVSRRFFVGWGRWPLATAIGLPLVLFGAEIVRTLVWGFNVEINHAEHDVGNLAAVAVTVTVAFHFLLVSGRIEDGFFRLWARTFAAFSVTYIVADLTAWEAYRLLPLKTNLLDQGFFLAGNLITLGLVVRNFRLRRAEPSPALRSRRVEDFGVTDREAQIIARLNRGLASKEIAHELHIGASTVKNHITSIYKKTGAKSRVELLNLLRSE